MLAQNLVDSGALPQVAGEDALHIAIAVTNIIATIPVLNDFFKSIHLPPFRSTAIQGFR